MSNRLVKLLAFLIGWSFLIVFFPLLRMYEVIDNLILSLRKDKLDG